MLTRGTDFLEKPETAPSRRRRARRAAGQEDGHARLLFSDGVIRRLFSPFEGAPGVVLAVSGGPDSVALMLIAARWRDLVDGPPPIYAATVDHRLRANAAREAALAADWAAALFLPHALLAWEGEKPKSRIQERAREARYELLFRYAATVDANYVLTAHHADDQAETILFRLLRGSGISGLAGMERISARHGMFLGRPLLDYTKADLVAYCTAKAHPYIEDPSNDDPAYARTRLRRLARLLAAEGLDRAALLRLGRRAARAEAALAKRADAVRGQLPALRQPGRFTADLSALKDEPDEILLRILALELKSAGSGKTIRLDRLENLAARLALALRAGTSYRATLGGAAVRLDSCHTLAIVKEGARRSPQSNAPNLS
jgi:tRNA(Ile)-lysidine synthase